MNDIQVIDVDPTTRLVTYGIKPKLVKGVSKLVQIVVISLLNIPGRDVLDPSLGGGLPSLLGSNIDPNDSTEIFGDVVRRIKKTESEVISAQIGINDAPDEKLAELQLVGIKRGDSMDAIYVTIRVINQAGQATEITV